MREYLRLFHPIKSSIAGLGAVAGYLIATGSLNFTIPLLLSFISISLIASGASVLSDYFRIEKDMIKNPEKPLPSGSINKKAARALSGSHFLIGIFLSYFINIYCLILATLGSLFLILYETLIKRTTAFFDNILIGFVIGSIPLFGGFAAGNYTLPGTLTLILSLSVIGRSIIKDIDYNENLGSKRVTLASYLGSDFAAWTAAAFMVTAVLMSPINHLLGLLGRNHLFILIIGDILLLYSAIKITNLTEAAKEAKIISEIGIFFLVVSYLTVLV